MNKKRIFISTIIFTVILLFILSNQFLKADSANGMLLDFVKDSAEENEPFVEESLIYGSAYKREENPEEGRYISLTEAEIRELLTIVSSTEVQKMDRLKIAEIEALWAENEGETYEVDMTNRGYTMPYDVELNFDMRPYDGKLLIWVHYNDHFLTEDFRVLDKVKEFYTVPRENE